MARKNPMGSEVVEGFACKPETVDPDKPIMFAAAQIFVCDGERCGACHSEDVAARVRGIVKEMGLHKGPDRIKVTRSGCSGACRHGAFTFAYQNGNARGFTRDTSFSAWKNVHLWTDEQWRELIGALRDGVRPESLREFVVEDKIYD